MGSIIPGGENYALTFPFLSKAVQNSRLHQELLELTFIMPVHMKTCLDTYICDIWPLLVNAHFVAHCPALS